MKKFQDDVSQISSIEEAYKYVDDNILFLEAAHDVTDFWVAYRNKTTDVKEKQMAQWELEFFLFHVSGSKIFSFSYSTGEKPGDVYEYPVLDEHQNGAFEYLKRRADEVQSNIIKARFNHLLWKAVKGIKNKVYAQKAIDEYIKILNLYRDKSLNQEGYNSQLLSRKCESLVSAVAETQYRVEDTVQLIRYLLLNVHTLKFYIKHSILEIALKYPSVFSKDSFVDLLGIFEGDLDISDSDKTDDFALAKFYLPTAIKIAAKLGQSSKEWDSKIAECYVRLGDRETDPERNWMKLQDYALAIQHFRNAGNVIRRQQIEEKYAELKDDVTLPTSVHEYDEEHIKHLKEIEEEIKEKTTKLLTLSPDSIYDIIGNGGYFPTNEFITNSFKNLTEPWLKGITTVKFDINKNIESISNEDDNLGDWMFQYKYYIRHTVSPYLYYTFIPGIRSRVLTYENLISYLATNTWLGSLLTKKDLGGEVIKYNWIGMVSPSILEFFTQMQSSLADENYKPNFILALDSLTIKFEGLFREFCTRIKTPTSTNNKKSMQEMYIHQLLQHPTVIRCFSEEDRTFFAFLFTKENGLNIRNNIAHCYFDYSDYSYSYFLLLLAALLRLAKYKFTISAKE